MIENVSRRGTAAAYPEPLRHAPNAALLIDFDNVTMGIRSDMQLQLKRMLSSEVFKGKISVQRAYADWRRYPQYIVPLSEASIDLIFAPAFGSNKKNATDIRLAIDALELVFTRPEIGTFILLSGDSDFSSLVLKLKEYGKYVIGVGIRESSSDLLIQNCDEYYGYSELTGLLKEGQTEHRRRDPWELVIEAATRMQQQDDVMRSDRLKQVMQEIDPNFDEKDAGFSKYSKFLQETSRRGLLKLNKLENGQYEIALGANANVSPEVEREAAEREPAASRERSARGRRRRGERGRDRESAGPARAAGGLVLADALALLRRALTDIGAVGDEATDADQARDRMVELHGDDGEEMFEPRRFQRFLRQAHDAGVVDLAKSSDGVYLLKLRPESEAKPPEESEDADNGDKEPRRRRRGGRGRGRGEREERGERPERSEATERRGRDRVRRDESAAPDEEGREPVAAQPAAAQRAAPESRRNPRFRRGSRGGGAAPAPEMTPEPKPVSEEARADVQHNRSLRGRRGRRGKGAPPAEGGTATGPVPGPVEDVRPDPEPKPREPVRERRPPPPREPPVNDARLPEDPTVEGGSLFKRMSAALQRAMLGKDEPQDS
ncbi:MAG: NYN domain-containing protein [Gemmatimonadota bacterium]|nr:NYN domain-containing protein [Gemmatimonadota bacterium]